MLSKNLLSKSGMLQSAFALQEVAMTTQDRAFARKCHDEGFGSQKSSEPELRDACSLKQGQFRQYLYQARDLT